MTNTIYHYCSNQKFVNIIKSGTLRMSDIQKSNDSSEMLLFYPKIFDIIREEYNKFPFECCFFGEKDYKGVDYLLKKIRNNLDASLKKGNLTDFVVCFCEGGDVLSQWKGYADNGKGCSIGFSVEEIKRYCAQYDNILKLEKVKYITDDELLDIIVKKSRDVLNKIENAFQMQTNFGEMGSAVTCYTIEILLEKIISGSLRYKNVAFAEEKEWRMYFAYKAEKNPSIIFGNKNFSSMNNLEEKVVALLMDKVDFNVTEDDITAYYPVLFSDFEECPIKEIILGPKNKISSIDMKLLLKKYNLLSCSRASADNIRILPSQITYR